MRAIVTVGVSASGKSTWARNFIHDRFKNDGERWVDINRDWERGCVLFDKTQGQVDKLVWRLWKWKWEDEVTRRCDAQLQKAAAERKNVVISDTNLNRGRREALVHKLEELGYEVELKHFTVSFEEACKRDAERENGVGYQVIAKQFEQRNAEFHAQHVPQKGLPRCIVVDIDGTIAHMKGRGPFDWTRVGEDSVDEVVNGMVLAFQEQGLKIVFLSGRDGCCYRETFNWLCDKTAATDFELYMRPAGDSRRDDIVKEELFFNHVEGRYNVFCVFDDRPQMIRKWHAMGLKVMAVANPYIEF
jgi:predicted kinase